MNDQVTVFRSADPSAEEDARAIQELLANAGISAELLDDNAPRVPAGCWEVRVAAGNTPRAETLVAAKMASDEAAERETPQGDTSHDLDLVTVFRAAGASAEMEATSIASVLDSNGIEAELVGDARLPILPFEVRVPRDHQVQARQLIAEALDAGPAGADEAQATEEK
jgi:hypothetical protein